MGRLTRGHLALHGLWINPPKRGSREPQRVTRLRCTSRWRRAGLDRTVGQRHLALRRMSEKLEVLGGTVGMLGLV